METQNELEIGIGDKEVTTLKPAKVKIVKVTIESVTTKDKKVVGDKVVCETKYPDREDTIKISTIKYVKGNQITESGIWFNKDEDDKIRKGSALAIFLEKVEAKNIAELKDKEVDTELDTNGYLCFKAY